VDWSNFSHWLLANKFVVIQGKEFSGKTTLAHIFMMEAIAVYRERYSAYNFAYFRPSDIELAPRWDTLYQAWFLVLDRPDLMGTRLYDVLCQRFDERKPTIITNALTDDWFFASESMKQRYILATLIGI
jgi:hypothetical protein